MVMGRSKLWGWTTPTTPRTPRRLSLKWTLSNQRHRTAVSTTIPRCIHPHRPNCGRTRPCRPILVPTSTGRHRIHLHRGSLDSVSIGSARASRQGGPTPLPVAPPPRPAAPGRPPQWRLNLTPTRALQHRRPHLRYPRSRHRAPRESPFQLGLPRQRRHRHRPAGTHRRRHTRRRSHGPNLPTTPSLTTPRPQDRHACSTACAAKSAPGTTPSAPKVRMSTGCGVSSSSTTSGIRPTWGRPRWRPS